MRAISTWEVKARRGRTKGAIQSKIANAGADVVGVITERKRKLVYHSLGLFESYASIQDIKRRINFKKQITTQRITL